MDALTSFREALRSLEGEIEEAQAERAQAADALAACDRRLEELRAEQHGIESYVRRHDPAAIQADGWKITRIEAVARVLKESDTPLSPGEIVDALVQVGRTDEMKDVAAALSHLKKRGRATNVTRGLWVHAEGRNEPAEVQGDVWTLPPDDDEEDISTAGTT
jgi:hypothetical protein